jgi:hypothetical protein
MKKLLLCTLALFLSSVAFSAIGTIVTFPDGSNGDVQFNKSRRFGADPGFSYSTTTHRLSVPGVSISTLTINGVSYTFPYAQGPGGTFARNDGAGGITWEAPTFVGVSTGVNFSVQDAGVVISSPTGAVNFQGTQFIVSLTGATTAFVTLNPSTVTLLGSSIDLASEVNGSLPAASIAAGNLGASVVASSIAVNAVKDSAITSVSGSKVTGNIPGNAAGITGTVNSSQVIGLVGSSIYPASATASFPFGFSASTGVFASSVSANDITVSSSIFVGDGSAFKKGVFYGGGGSVVSTILELRNSGTSGAGTGSRLYFTEGSNGQFEQGSFEFVDEAAAGIGETFNLYLTPTGSPASRFRSLKMTSSSAFGPPEYWFGPGNAGTAIFDFKSQNPIASNSTAIMRVSGNGTNHRGDILQLYARDNTTQRLRVSEGGSMVLNGSHTIEGAGGLGVTYGAVVGSMTVSNLAANQCVQTGTGGLLTVTGSACGSGGGGSGSSVYPATATAQFPFGVEASTIVVSTVTLSGSMKFTSRNGVLLAPDGTKLLSMPDNQTMYFGNGSATNPTAGGTFNACGGTGCMAGVTTESFSSCWGNSCMANGALTGQQNNCQGYACQANRTSSSYNACVGGSCQLAGGGDNNFCGGSVCQSGLTTGFNNACTGHQCQYQLKDGFGNSAGGFQAGGGTEPITMSNVSGSNNTNYGNNSGQSVSSSTVISNSFSYGAKAIVGCSNCGVLGNPLVPMYVGIGTTTPRANFTVAGASGIYVSYGADVGSMTVRDLASGQCVQTGAGGRLTVTGSACGSGGGAGFSIYPATATAGFPLGLTASTATINDLTVTTLTVVGSGGGGGVFAPTEGTAPSGLTGADVLWADSGAHWFKFNPNNASTYTVVGTSNPVVAGHYAKFSSTGSLYDDGAGVNIENASFLKFKDQVGGGAFIYNPYSFVPYMEIIAPNGVGINSITPSNGYDLTTPGILTSTITVTSSATIANLNVTGVCTGCGGAGGTPALPFRSVQFNNAGAFGGSASFNWSGSSLTVSGPLLTSTQTILSGAASSINTTKGALDVYVGDAPTAGTAILASFGSNQQADQFIIQDQKPLNLTRYGVNFGGLQGGLAATPNTIYSNQSSQSNVNWWNAGEMEIKTATSGNGGKEITLYPQQVEVMRVSNTKGVVIKSSMTVPVVSYGLSSITNNYTATSTSTVILADAGTASLTVTLPTAIGNTGLVYRIKRLNSGANTVTIATTAAQTIDGATTQILTTQYTSVDVISDGANWSIL